MAGPEVICSSNKKLGAVMHAVNSSHSSFLITNVPHNPKLTADFPENILT
jgi:hypothetical protein